MPFYSLLRKSNTSAAILAVLAALSFSISMTLVKQLHQALPTTFIVFARSFIGLIFFISFIIKGGVQPFKTTILPLHILRVLLIISAMSCTYYAYRNLPIAFATSIGMTGALFTTILSVFFLKENIGFLQWILVFIGYCGVILVIKPTSLIIELATLIALLANLFAACSIVTVKVISRYDSTATIMLYSNIGVTIISGLLNFNEWPVLSARDIFILCCTGILGVASQFCSVTALKYSSPSFTAPFEYTRIIFATLIGMVLFQELPNLHIIIGVIIIICSTYLLTYIGNIKIKSKRKAKDDS